MSEKSSFFKGKRFLVTQPMIRSFCGSTMVTLELAKYLTSVGASVTVYTNIALRPALLSFEAVGIKIISAQDEYDFSLKNFDYVWIHSLTIPKQVLDELKNPPKKIPAFIFLHMSSFEKIPDEHPWIYGLENSLSSLSLYISEETLESNEKYGLPPKVDFFRNPAPVEFKKLAKRKIAKNVRKVLIVSNHPPAEVIDAKKILIDSGLRVDIYGEGQDEYTSLSQEILKKYDAVITIGKTVQYCIIGSYPVYIYDWFGGCGWLTKSNYELLKAKNFSGRGFSKKTGEEIAYEIMSGYSEAVDFHLNFLVNNNEFMIDEVLRNLLCGLKPRKLEAFNSEYIESAKAAVHCAEIRFASSEELGKSYEYCDDLMKQIENYKKQIQFLDEYKKKYDELSNSKRMRLLDSILKPHDKIKGFLKRK